jgi:hypothetical protein
LNCAVELVPRFASREPPCGVSRDGDFGLTFFTFALQFRTL